MERKSKSYRPAKDSSKLKINIFNFQKDISLVNKDIEDQVNFLLTSSNIRCDEISIYYVNEKTIIDLHNKYFSDPTITDCITFPIDNNEKDKKRYCHLGEIFICPKKALDYSKENNINFKEELCLYLVHGFLHLLGYEDDKKESKRVMRKEEKKYIEILKQNNFL